MSVLLLTNRDLNEETGYEHQTVTLKKEALSYKIDGSKLELDHLEPDSIKKGDPQYFCSDDLDERKRVINSYVGNFMILDKKPNIEKGTDPLAKSMSYYDAISKSWLIQDINEMIECDDYFTEKKVPKEEFFKRRTAMLRAYFDKITDTYFTDEIKVEI